MSLSDWDRKYEAWRDSKCICGRNEDQIHIPSCPKTLLRPQNPASMPTPSPTMPQRTRDQWNIPHRWTSLGGGEY